MSDEKNVNTWPLDESTSLPTKDDSAALNPPPSLYLVVAYRWGQTNGHQYHVYCGPDRVKAIALAQVEVADRGGKYGCAVYEFDATGVDYLQVAYLPSMMEDDDSDAPYHNHRIDYFEHLGHFMDDACDGSVYVPNEEPTKEGFRTLKRTPVEPPAFLTQERDRQRELLAVWEKLHAERVQQRREKK